MVNGILLKDTNDYTATNGTQVVLVSAADSADTINISTFLLRFKDPWLWTYNPLSLMLLNLRKYSIKIYHAVDALQQQPDMPSSLISSEEKRLCQKVDHVFVTSPKLMESLALYSNSIRFDPNVVDYEHFSKSLICNKDDLPEDLASIPEPRIGFIGAISSYKINIHLVADLARTNPKWNFVFIGPTEEGESFTDLNPWSNLQNIYHLGPRTYSILPRYCAGFSCGWLPLCKNKYTESMFPMKFFEYLAAGLPVVATSIDSLIKFSSVTFLCGPSTDEFSIAINSAISGHGPNLNQRLSIARDNSYKNRLKKMLNFISNNSKN